MKSNRPIPFSRAFIFGGSVERSDFVLPSFGGLSDRVSNRRLRSGKKSHAFQQKGFQLKADRTKQFQYLVNSIAARTMNSGIMSSSQNIEGWEFEDQQSAGFQHAGYLG
jgi:hypothetical protein